MPEKIHIEKNSVQETLLIPLYSRVQCTKLYPQIYGDPESEKVLARVDYDFSKVRSDGMAVKFGALEAAMRQAGLRYGRKDGTEDDAEGNREGRGRDR